MRSLGRIARWCCALGLVAAASAAPLEIGFSTHQTSDAGLDMIAQSGATTIREDIRWQWVEVEKGRLAMPAVYERYVDQAIRRGLKPLLILDYGNPHYDGGSYPLSPEALAGYVRFCEFVVQHFRGRVFLYEIWNEWNVGTDMQGVSTPEDYVILLAATYRALERLAPEVTVIGGSMSGNGLRDQWLQRACDAGMLYFLDALSFHPYCWGGVLEDRLPDIGVLKRIRDLEAVIAKYPRGDTVPLYITELGWPTHIGPDQTTEEEAAAFLARSALLLATMPRVRGLWWYGWSDNGPDETDYLQRYGVVTHDLRPKPGFAAAREVARFLRRARSQPRWRATPNTRTVSFRDARGRPHVAAWTIDGRETLRLFAGQTTAGLRVTQSSPLGVTLARSWEKREGRGFYRVTVNPAPTFIIPLRE